MSGSSDVQGTDTAAGSTAILVRNCGLSPDAAAQQPDASLEELGLDSLALLELQAVVTDRYRVRLPDELTGFTVADVAALVDRQGAAAGAPDGGSGGDTVGRTENSVVIAAPLDLVWELTNDVANWPDLFTEYSAAEVLDRRGDTVRFRLTLVPEPDGTVWSWVSERVTDRDRYEVHGTRIELGWFEYMRIHWRYEPVPEGTRMTWVQEFHMREDAPVDDVRMTDRINTNTREQMRVIAERVERFARQGAATAHAGAPAPHGDR